jgi:hypothetical protein
MKTEVPRLPHKTTGNVPILEQLQNIPAHYDDLLKQMLPRGTRKTLRESPKSHPNTLAPSRYSKRSISFEI